MARLLRKWLDIVLHSSCYYPLETVLVTGIGLPDIEDFKEQTPNEEGYYLEFPMEFINTMRFLFPALDMVFHIETGEVYNIVTLKEITEENQAAIELLRKLVEAQGLFLV